MPVLEGEHPPGTGKAALDLIDDQRHPGLLGDPAQATQPFDVRRDHAAFALHHLDDHRRGSATPASGSFSRFSR
jgi:hypothetical protein